MAPVQPVRDGRHVIAEAAGANGLRARDRLAHSESTGEPV